MKAGGEISIESMACAVASFDFPAASAGGGVELSELCLDPPDWTRLISYAESSRLEGPLAWSVANGACDATEHDRDAVYASHRRAMALTLTLERELVEVGADFTKRSIPFRVLKGSALARLDEADPSLRAFGDVDLLVQGQHIEAAEDVLKQRGGIRRYPEPRSGFDRRFSKGASYAFSHNAEVDLHRTLASGPFGLTIDLDELFMNTDAFSIGPHALFALDRPSRFIHACCHAVLGSAAPRITTLRDVALTAPKHPSEARIALDRARRWQVDSVVAAAVQSTQQRLGWRPSAELAAWAAHHVPSRRSRRWLAGYVGGGRSYAKQAINALEAVSGPTNKLAYALAISLPAPAPGRTPTSERLRRGARALRQDSR